MKSMALEPLPLLDEREIQCYFQSEDYSGSYFSARIPRLPEITWTSEEVYSYLKSVCSAHNVCDASLRNFAEVDGWTLLQMSLEAFQRLDPVNGSFFYHQIRSSHRQDPYDRREDSPSSNMTSHSGDSSYISSPSPPVLEELHLHGGACAAMACGGGGGGGGGGCGLGTHALPEDLYDLPCEGLPNHHVLSEEDEGCYGFAPSMPPSPYALDQYVALYPTGQTSPSPLDASAGSYYPDNFSTLDDPSNMRPSPPVYGEQQHSPCPDFLVQRFPCLNVDGTNSSQSPVGSRNTRRGQGQSSQSRTPGTSTRRNRERGPKLYEFLWCLLRDPCTNPSLIRWESLEERVFRLVNQAELSKRWGERRPSTKGESLPYGHFARAIRYYYRKRVILSVRDKKLVYSFGERTFNDLSQKFGPPIL